MSKGWTRPEIERLRAMYKGGESFAAISAVLRRTSDACRQKASSIGLKDRGKSLRVVKSDRAVSELSTPYGNGRACRLRGGGKISPHSIGREHWSWLAGWHDADMELGVSYIGAALESR